MKAILRPEYYGIELTFQWFCASKLSYKEIIIHAIIRYDIFPFNSIFFSFETPIFKFHIAILYKHFIKSLEFFRLP